MPIRTDPSACGCELGRAGAAAIADELVALTTKLSDLAYDLGSDPVTVRRHMNSLQAIDLITQIQLALADFLRSDAPLPTRIAEIPVEELSASLGARLSMHPPEDGIRTV